MSIQAVGDRIQHYYDRDWREGEDRRTRPGRHRPQGPRRRRGRADARRLSPHFSPGMAAFSHLAGTRDPHTAEMAESRKATACRGATGAVRKMQSPSALCESSGDSSTPSAHTRIDHLFV